MWGLRAARSADCEAGLFLPNYPFLAIAELESTLQVSYIIDGSNGYSRWHCLIYVSLNWFGIFFSEIIILAMAFDRFIAINFPLYYHHCGFKARFFLYPNLSLRNRFS